MTTNWFHYIGNPGGFIQPALQFGMSRPCPISIARQMQFGDRVILLKWRGSQIPPAAFAEARISGISFDGVDIGNALVEQGKATYEQYSGGGIEVSRECGSFTLVGSYVLADDVTLGDVIDIAERNATELGISVSDIRCMMWGKIVAVHPVPLTVTPPPPFTRGWMRVPDGTRIGDAPINTDTQNSVYVVENYERKRSELE